MSNWAIPGALKIYQMIPPTVTLHGGTCLPDSVSMNILTNHIALTSLERNEMKKELNATKEDWLFHTYENICKKLFGVGCKQGHSKTVFLLKEYCFWPPEQNKSNSRTTLRDVRTFYSMACALFLPVQGGPFAVRAFFGLWGKQEAVVEENCRRWTWDMP